MECKHCGKEENEEIIEEPPVVVDKIIKIEIEEEDEEPDILEKMKIVIDKELSENKDVYKIETVKYVKPK